MNERAQETPSEEVEEATREPPSHRRSQRPSKPLTHRLDPRQLQAAYYRAGLLRPELEAPPRPQGQHKQRRSDRPPVHAVKETPAMHEADETQKPGVAGTRQQQQAFGARNVTPVTEAQKCAMYGGTTILAGSALMLIWKGLTKWLG